MQKFSAQPRRNLLQLKESQEGEPNQAKWLQYGHWQVKQQNMNMYNNTQPIQKQIQPQKHVVHAEVHVPIETPEPEIPSEAQIPDAALHQVRHPPTPKGPI